MLKDIYKNISSFLSRASLSVVQTIKNFNVIKTMTTLMMASVLYFFGQVVLGYLFGSTLTQLFSSLQAYAGGFMFGLEQYLPVLGDILCGVGVLGVSYAVNNTDLVLRAASGTHALGRSVVSSAANKVVDGVTSVINTFKGIAVVLVRPNRFARIATVLPIGGWMEYVPQHADQRFSLFQCAASYIGTEEELENMLKVLPKASLYRMLEERDSEYNLTSLAWAAEKVNRKFELILSAIEPEHRIRFLTAPVGKGEDYEPLAFTLNVKRSAEKNAWDVIRTLLTPSQLKELLRTKNASGDRLLVYQVQRYSFTAIKNHLSVFNSAEKKAYIQEMCPHGLNMAVYIFECTRFKYAKEAFELLPKEDWLDILATKPAGWSMSIGEKIMVVLYANYAFQNKELTDSMNQQFLKPRYLKAKSKLKSHQEEFEATIKFMDENYQLKLPARYRDLDEEQCRQVMLSISQGMASSECSKKGCFFEQFNDMPESVLGVEPLSEPKVYITAYRKLQLKHHPDRNNGQGCEMSAKLNAAKEFLTDEEARENYCRLE